VRERALRDGKLLYMAVPKLAEDPPFYEFNPGSLPVQAAEAASRERAAKVARRVGPGQMRPVDMAVCGSVAVNRDGTRLGKGAFAQALHDTLAAQVPSQQASLNASLAATLASVPDGPAKKSGIAAGAHEASVILTERAGDGLDTASVDIPWTPPPPIPLTSPDAAGVTRTYTDWKTITDDVINARVWEGVHFRTSDIKGVDQGLRVARWEAGRLAEIGL